MSESNQVHTVKRGLMTASIWNVISNLGTQTATFAIFLILARLLAPSDFGMVAASMAFIDITRGIMLGGIPEALIQRKEWNDDDASAAFWLNLIAGSVFTLLILMTAIVAQEYSSNGITWFVLSALASTLIIDGLRGVHEAHLRRNFRYKVLAVRSVVASVIAGIVGIVIALAGGGVWALVFQRILTSAMQTMIIWSSDVFKPRFVSLRGKNVRDLLKFSTGVLWARSLGQINRRLADIVLAALAGPHVLGLYRVGTRSLDYIMNGTVTPIQSATLSAFARLQDGESRARAYVRSTEFTALTTIPAAIGAGAIAPDFIQFAFGAKWAASAWPMILLSFGIIPMTYMHYFQAAMQAAGRPTAASGPELLRLTAGAIILSIAAPFGLVAASFGEMLRRYIVSPSVILVLRRELGISWRDAFEILGVPAFWSVIMFAAIVACRHTVLADQTILIRLACSVIVGAVVYAGGILLVSRRFTRRIVSSIAPVLPGKFQRLAQALLKLL